MDVPEQPRPDELGDRNLEGFLEDGVAYTVWETEGCRSPMLKVAGGQRSESLEANDRLKPESEADGGDLRSWSLPPRKSRLEGTFAEIYNVDFRKSTRCHPIIEEVNEEESIEFTEIRAELTKEEEYSKPQITKCEMVDRPEIKLNFEGIDVLALIDTGSNITCVSEEFYTNNYARLQRCTTLPVVGMQVSGFTGEKSVRLKKQIRVQVQIGRLMTELNFLVIPKLTRPCILGIDAQAHLKMVIDTGHGIINMSVNHAVQCLTYGTTTLSNHDQGIMLMYQDFPTHEPDEYIPDKEERDIPHWDGDEQELDISDEEIQGKMARVESINPEFKQKLIELVKKHRAIFSKKLGRCRVYEHRLRVTHQEPFCKKSYPVPIQYREKVDAEIQRMLKLDVIERSFSPYINPLVPVIKKNGTVRVCLDARELNNRLLPDHDGPEEIESVIRKCKNVRVMTSIDLASSFWQIPLEEKSREYTAFLHQGKTFHHKVVPFGLKVSGAALTRGTEGVLKGLQEWVIDFVDDWLCVSTTLEEHLRLLDVLFTRIHEAGFTVNFDKVEFCRQELKFLGHILSTQGIRVDPEKLRAINEFTRPKTQKQLKGFMGLVNFCGKFTHKLADSISPLLELLRKGVKWKWTDVHERSFEQCKKLFSESVALYHPDTTKPFCLVTDASQTALGAFLYQEDAEGQRHLVTLASRTLRGPELNYCTTEVELLAIVWALHKFRPYLLGSQTRIQTDHKALTFLSTCRFLSARLTRWMLAIQDYDIKIEHIEGARNHIADALSRMTKSDRQTYAVIEVLTARKPSKELSRMIRRLGQIQREDPRLRPIIEELESGLTRRGYNLVKDTLYKGTHTKRAVLPDTAVTLMIQEVHELYAHIGAKKCYKMIEETFFARKLRSRVAEYVKTCDSCQRNKTYTQAIHAETTPIVPNGKGDLLSIDYYGPLPTSRGGVKYILAVIDAFTKYVCLYPIKREDTRTTVRKMQGYLEEHGVPKRIQTDHGSQFTAKGWARFIKEQGIRHIFSSIRHPQSNMVERINKELGRFFRTLTAEKHKNWATWVPLIQNCLNETYHETTERAPYELQHGQRPNRIWTTWIDVPTETINHENTVRIAYQHIKTKGEKRAIKTNQRNDFTRYGIGDLVLVKACNVSSVELGITAKFLALYEGPYKVSGVMSKCTYRLHDLEYGRERGKFHISALRPYHDAQQQKPTAPPENPSRYRAERIADLQPANTSEAGRGQEGTPSPGFISRANDLRRSDPGSATGAG